MKFDDLDSFGVLSNIAVWTITLKKMHLAVSITDNKFSTIGNNKTKGKDYFFSIGIKY